MRDDPSKWAGYGEIRVEMLAVEYALALIGCGPDAILDWGHRFGVGTTGARALEAYEKDPRSDAARVECEAYGAAVGKCIAAVRHFVRAELRAAIPPVDSRLLQAVEDGRWSDAYDLSHTIHAN